LKVNPCECRIGTVFGTIAIAVTGVFLAGCDALSIPQDMALSLQVGQDGTQFIAPALEATAEQFFRPGGGSATPGTVLVDIDKNTLSANSKTPYRNVRSRQIALAARLDHPLGKNLSFRGALALTQGNSRFVLPQGAGVLRDPITIRFSTQSVEIETGLVLTVARQAPVETQLEFGIGGKLARTRTHIGSALLNVQNISTSQTGFAFAGISLKLSPEAIADHPARLVSRVKISPTKAVSLQTGLSVDF